jgi:hypothetical protein
MPSGFFVTLMAMTSMAKEKLFPTKAPDDDQRDPHDKFSDLASKVVTVPKSEIDERDKQWQRNKSSRKQRPV